MKNYRKVISFACVSLLCLSALTGCQTKTGETETQSSAETSTPAVTEKPTERQTESQSEPATEEQSEPQSESETTASTETGTDSDATASTGEERYFFDAEGNTIYTSQNSAGDWTDKNGTVYTFLENGVTSADGTQYYYDPPAYRTDGAEASGTDSGNVADLYRKDGTLVTLTKNSNGNWSDSNGITYELREDGAMDSNGEFHPW